MVGITISHFKILEKIGQGGMGEVFLAQDTTLDRKVALKFLPDFLQQDSTARKRFLREAKSAAALDHPYICHIHEVGESDGKDFIAMEYVQGQTLKDKLAKGPLPLKEALEITVEIAEAVERAHGKGIVHRDLKPSNVMVTPDGHVKVMDFGLAKRLLPEDAGSQEQTITANLTKTGTTLGTLAYMSPEQLRGQEVDTRSDIFSFGVLLYEMLTGVHPFRKPEQIETASAILRDDPPPLSKYVPEFPEGLEKTVEKTLTKEPEQRYESAREVRVNLKQLVSGSVPFIPARRPLTRRGWLALTGLAVLAALVTFVGLDVAGWRDSLARLAGVSGEPRIESLAVLPLANLSGDPEQEYLAAGMHEALITDLAKLGGFKRVIPSSSVRRYRETDQSLAEIAQELGVDALVTASVLRSGDRVQITAQLINGATEEHLWADRYERELRDVLTLQNEIVSVITREMNLQLTPQEQVRLASARTVNPEVYETYLKGDFHLRNVSPQEADTALQYFQLALEKDPNYAPAYAGIGRVWIQRGSWFGVSPHEAMPRGKVAAEKAIQLDDSLGLAHWTLASVLAYYEWDWVGAEREYKRAIELNPNLTGTSYSMLLLGMRRPEAARTEIERVIALDPLNSTYQGLLGILLFQTRQYDDAIAQCRKTLRAAPNFSFAHAGLWAAFHEKGMYAEALAAAQKFYAVSGYPEAAQALGSAGVDYSRAMILAAEALASSSRVHPFYIARLYAYAGEKGKTLEWLEQAYEERETDMVFLGVDPTFDSLRDDPRFQDLMRRVNLPL